VDIPQVEPRHVIPGGSRGRPTELPLDFLRGAVDATTFSDAFVRDLEIAAETSAAAKRAAADAVTAHEWAETRATFAEGTRTALVTLLSWVQPRQSVLPVAATNQQWGKTGPQTLIDGSACPTSAPAGTLRDGSASVGIAELCREAVAGAATPQAALAIQAAFQMLGAPYACGGVGRNDPFQFDCSSLVSRAYYLGAGIDTAGDAWAPSTREMVPWDGVPLAWWASYVDPKYLRPGDLVLYDTGGATYRHVVMYIGNGYMLHTNSCGDVAHVSAFWGTSRAGFLVVRRVVTPGDFRIPDPRPIPTGPIVPPVPPPPGIGDPKVPPGPTPSPTPTPTGPVTPSPSDSPTGTPTESPSGTPTDSPTESPTDGPTDSPTESPTDGPTDSPTESPTDGPTDGSTGGAASGSDTTADPSGN